MLQITVYQLMSSELFDYMALRNLYSISSNK